MKKNIISFIILVAGFVLATVLMNTYGARSFIPDKAPSVNLVKTKKTVSPFEKLIPLHQIKKDPGPYDWLATHPEPGQTFDEYLNASPVVPDDKKKIIYVMLLGDFDNIRREIVEKTTRYMQAYFQMPVEFVSEMGLDVIPEHARRKQPLQGNPQILTRYVMEQILIPSVPDDAFCLIAFSSQDLWPGQGWNFVFGSASIDDRVGVWSIYRNGDPNEGEEAYKLCLKRTIKTGTHEVGHMFGMRHCIFYECNMNGSNHRQESDEAPLWLCPVCLRKLDHALKGNLQKRFEDLMQISDKLNFKEENKFFKKEYILLKE
ncbi:MAG: hypothetical protein KAJ18_11830 [Candidatus Omnitrophica bacterium]|nr:hypothetical protein [Candidatus Omnitrophota bacterium]